MSCRVLPLVLVLVAGACAYDGPSPGVRVASSGLTESEHLDEAVDAADDIEVAAATEGAAAVDDPEGGESTRDAGRSGGGGRAGSIGLALPPTLPDSVAVVGDSLTLSAEDEIATAFGRLGIDVFVVDAVENRRMARGGSTLPPGTAAIEEIVDAGRLPDLWVVALGTNDVGAQASTTTFGDDVAAVLRRLPSTSQVVWVDVWIRDRADAASQANDVIRSMLALRPHSHVVDWYAHGEQPDVITADGVHLTERGRQQFATAMADGVIALTSG